MGVRDWLRDISRASAFIFRDFHLSRRYAGWGLVFTFYAFVNSAIVVLIGVASGDQGQTRNLLLGALIWSFLGALFHDIANSIAYERWEGTIEYTFMAPVSRLTHLLGVSVFASVEALLRMLIVLAALLLFVPVSFNGANLAAVLLVFLLSSLTFMGLGIIAAILPLLSPEKGAQGTEIIQALLLLVSGVYYPVTVLPGWLQPLSALSPATYTLNACRKLIGIGADGTSSAPLQGASLADVSSEMLILALFGLCTIPAGLYIFERAEEWAKRAGKLKRSG